MLLDLITFLKLVERPIAMHRADLQNRSAHIASARLRALSYRDVCENKQFIISEQLINGPWFVRSCCKILAGMSSEEHMIVKLPRRIMITMKAQVKRNLLRIPSFYEYFSLTIEWT
jgi:hypothetical protein